MILDGYQWDSVYIDIKYVGWGSDRGTQSSHTGIMDYHSKPISQIATIISRQKQLVINRSSRCSNSAISRKKNRYDY